MNFLKYLRRNHKTKSSDVKFTTNPMKTKKEVHDYIEKINARNSRSNFSNTTIMDPATYIGREPFHFEVLVPQNIKQETKQGVDDYEKNLNHILSQKIQEIKNRIVKDIKQHISNSNMNSDDKKRFETEMNEIIPELELKINQLCKKTKYSNACLAKVLSEYILKLLKLEKKILHNIQSLETSQNNSQGGTKRKRKNKRKTCRKRK